MPKVEAMDVKALIEQLELRASRNCADGYAIPFDKELDEEAATALSTLFRELAEARAELADAELGILALMWLPGVRAALDKLPPGEALQKHMARLEGLVAAESSSASKAPLPHPRRMKP